MSVAEEHARKRALAKALIQKMIERLQTTEEEIIALLQFADHIDEPPPEPPPPLP